MPRKATTTPKRRARHCFRMKYKLPSGKIEIIEAWAEVKTARKGAKVVLLPEHAQCAIDNEGCGNSQMCTVSTAIEQNAKEFSHPVVGPVDFQYRTVFVASKLKKGLPVECYRYLHNTDIAKWNDTPGGMKKLLAELSEEGAREITLAPRRRDHHTWKTPKGKKTGKLDGSRSKRATTSDTIKARGAKRRFLFAMAGGYGAVPSE